MDWNDSLCNALATYELMNGVNLSFTYWKTILNLFSFFRQKPPSHFSFLTQHQISWQLRMSSTCSSYRIFSLELSLVLTNFWILWFKWPWNNSSHTSPIIFLEGCILRFNSCIKYIFIIYRIFSHCQNSYFMHKSDLVKFHFTLFKF